MRSEGSKVEMQMGNFGFFFLDLVYWGDWWVIISY